MKERPIIFSDAMVRAILAGRKTQTRRVMKPQPIDVGQHREWHSKKLVCWLPQGTPSDDLLGIWDHCPYGQPGDRLWVREMLICSVVHDGRWRYDADSESVMVAKGFENAAISWAHHKDTEWCASIHMPRWASRITLEIVNVRIERVQDVSVTGVEAEGVDCLYEPHTRALSNHYNRQIFQTVWDKINAKRGFGWATNPWVWVVEFRRLPPASGQGSQQHDISVVSTFVAGAALDE